MNSEPLPPSYAMVVNDDPIQLNILSGLVRKAGLEPRAFTGAEAALAEMSAWLGTGDRDLRALPALVVTDLYMPGIDGWQFCRLLRSPENAAFNQVPILVVSATFAGDETGRITADLGAEAFLPTPVDGKHFVEQVQTILSGQRVRTPLHVLIVESSQTLSNILHKTFADRGYHADIALTARAATAAFGKTAYDVALLDYHLPDGKGDVLLDTFRVQRPDCVCLMMTTGTGSGLALDWMKRGAAAYLQKPFQPAYLIELCSRARRERALLRVQDLLEVRTRELRESEEKYRILLEESPDPIFSFSPEGQYMYVNRSFANGVGKPVEDIIGKRIWDVFPKEEADKRFTSLSQVFRTGEEKVIEVRVPRTDYDRYYMTTITPIKDTFGNAVSAICSSKDITKRKLAEDELLENRRRLADVIDFLPDATLAIDKEKRIIIWNKEIEKMTAVPAAEMIGKGDYAYTIPFYGEARPQLMDLIFMDNRDVMARYPNLIREGDSLVAEVFCNALYDNKGAWVFLKASPLHDPSGNIIGAIESIRDITERKRAEEEKAKLEIQLQQTLKFEAIGTLAGGIAHDFNNLLMGIQGRASLISLELETSHPHLEHIHAIEEYIRSATSLTRQLLGFARGGKYEVKPVDMNELVLGSSAMFGRTRKEIKIHTNCQESPQVAEADRGQIEQVLLNMYINAWQSMPPEGGELYLETKIVTLDEDYCNPHQTKPGRYVKVSITDTGSGMDEATRQRIFDPFFTTKEKSRGTGMGLASAYGIIKNHGGMITLYSETGHGTTFNIYLPVSDKDAYQEIPKEKGLIKGSSTILLVDDEEMIIDVGQAILESLGYCVMVCRGGQEAVQTITDRGSEIDLVILDLIMPGMDGGTTFDRIRGIQPGMPVLLSSGYANNCHADKIMRRGCNGFIQKPYNISELSQKIRKVLDESKGSTQQ
jgi:two-component system, cell cycle sensor histidine kinase and response regulator CckA